MNQLKTDRQLWKTRIARDANNINIILFLLILALMFSIVIIIINSINNENSRDLVRAYSVEASQMFYSYISEDLTLVRKAANSRAITGWFTAENDETRKRAALDEITDYANVLQNAHLYLCVDNSMNEYTLEGITAYDDFIPIDALSPLKPDDDWYYDCKNSSNSYTLNIGYDRFTAVWRLWINHKVETDGIFTGAFCSGLRIPDIFIEIFKKYNAKTVRGYIIDKNGTIKSDSTNYIFYSTENEVNILDEYPDQEFQRTLTAYLGHISGLFSKDSRLLINRVSGGYYNYSAIIPIESTDWSVVIFYKSNIISDISHLMPLLLIMLIAMLLYMIGRNAIMNRMIFLPLYHLTQSVSNKSLSADGFYGSGRDDEIGILSRSIGNAVQERQRQGELLHAVNSVATVLITAADTDDIHSSILKSMQIIGSCVNADRMHIWQNEKINDELFYVNRAKWYSDTGAWIEPAPAKRSYSEMPKWEKMFLNNEYVNSPVSALTKQEQDILLPQGVKSILAIPLFTQNRLWGYFSFDDCRRERTFTGDEVEILRSAGLIITSAMNRNIQAAELINAYKRTQTLLDSMPMTCQLWNSDGKMFDCNEEAVKLLKAKNKQDFIERFFDFSPEYQSDGQLSVIKSTIYLGKAFMQGRCVFEWTHQTSDGTLLPMEVTLVKIKFGEEDIVAGYNRDLREHKQMMADISRRDYLHTTLNKASAMMLQSEISEYENGLYRSTGLLSEAVGIQRVTIWQNSTKDGEIYCSRLFEWAQDDVNRQNSEYVKNIPYKENIPGWLETLSRGDCVNGLVSTMSAREQAQLCPQGILSIFVVPVFVYNEFWGFVGYDDCRRERIFSGDEQSILRSASMLIASSWLRQEVTLNIRATADKLEAVIANYPGIIWNVDYNNVITLFNGRYLNEMGMKPEFFEGKKLDESLQDDRFSGILASVQKTLAGKNHDINCEFEGRIFNIRSTFIRDVSGNISSVMGSFDDMTERIRLQGELEEALKKAQEASNAKSSFLANMSHEMRTPLNAVIGLSELLMEESSLAGDIQENLEKIYNSGETLLSTVNDILDISKIEAGRFELIKVEYAIPSMINDAITQSIMRKGDKPIDFILDIREDLPMNLYGDDLRIKQMLNNLLSNAFKYTMTGTVKLEIKCERSQDDVLMTARISDTGIGIRSEDIDKLFADYAKIDPLSNRKIEGTGLGLPITKKLAEMMDGSITVESEYGKGSTFILKIKQHYVSNAIIGPEVVKSLKSFHYSDHKRKKNSRMVKINLSYAKVLVVDDVDTNLDVAKGMMKPYGMKIDCVTSGQEAVNAVREAKVKYNAIFMDHMMPGMDGIETVRIIRQEIGTDYAKNVPIIALTANAIVGNEGMFLKNGFQTFLPKPIEVDRLDTVIREWVRDREYEKTVAYKKILINGELSLDPRKGAERRSFEDRRRGVDRRSFGKIIPGLDMQNGLDRFGGDMETYTKVLRSYRENTPSLLDKIREPVRENLAEYAVYVHGLKGSSLGISATLLAEKAMELEEAAKTGNWNYIASENAGFIGEAEKLMIDLTAFLEAASGNNLKPIREKPDAKVLSGLLEACIMYNMDGVDAAMEEIEKYSYESDNDLAKWLRTNIEQMNVKQIKEKLSAYLKKEEA